MSETPDVSVIVPARNAAALLPATLRGLAAQRFPGSFEVIVVDNASTDETAEIARAAGVRVLVNERDLGPAGSRNRGAAEARAQLLAFTDADCVPAPDWLARGVAALDGAADLVQGAVRPDPATPVRQWDRTLLVTDEVGLYETANLFVRRAAFERAGGFPAFLADAPGLGPGLRPGVAESPFGEDTLFAWRARAAGARTAFAADAIVDHAVFPRGRRDFLRERWRLRYFPSLVREAPGMRDRLLLRTFLTRRTAAFDLALVGLASAVGSRRALPLLAAVPYAVIARPQGAGTRPLVRAGIRAAGDAVGCAALVRGSIAARRPVL